MLDLAFNRITEIKGLNSLTKLKKLFLSSNKISKIENLDNLQSLELLELGDNKIRVSSNQTSVSIKGGSPFISPHRCSHSLSLFQIL